MASSSSSVQVLETESRRDNLRKAILSLLWEWRHFDDQLACMNPASVESSGFESQQFSGGGLFFENKLKELESKEAYFVTRAKELDFQEDSVKRRAQLLDLKEKEIEIREGGLCFAQSFVQERAKELDAQQKLIDARVKQLELKEKQIVCVKTEQFMHNSCNFQGSEGALPRSSMGTSSSAAVISNSGRDQSVFRQQDDVPTVEDVTVSRVISEGVICPYIGPEADSNHTIESDPVTMAGGAGYEIRVGHVPIEVPNGGVGLLKFRESETVIRSSSRIRQRNLGVLSDHAHSSKKFSKSRSSTDGTTQEQTQPRPIHTEKFKVNHSVDIPSASNAGEGNVKKKRCASTNPLDLNAGKESVYDSSEYTFNLFNRSDPALYDFPDPEFSNFDKDKEARCFTAGQIWAIYDIIDSMPRFYAEILKVHSPGFKLLIMWLDADPENQDEISWVDNGLPVSCGKFKLSVPEETSDHLMFSHQVYIERSKGYYGIYPRKGETWALLKDWDIRWNSEPEKHKKFSFEIVEILSGNVYGAGIRVVYLEKIKGFVSLFQRMGGIQDGSVLISSKELLRFSHRIPSFKMSGSEREGVPKCSVELDPAALPMDVIKSPGVCASFSEVVGKCDRGKSANKFQPGQIWAVYSCEDGMPKTYVQIMKVDSSPFKLHAALLEPCSRRKQPCSCGIFEVQPRSTRTFPPEYFSHEVKVGSYCKNIYGIYPREGEIWAVYKSWNTKRSFSDRKKNECEIVQILKNKDTCIEVSCLVQMTGAACIFKALRTKNSMPDCLKIQRGELSLFSHQIPAIQRIGENKCWELDPASVPDEALLLRGCRMERPSKRPR